MEGIQYPHSVGGDVGTTPIVGLVGITAYEITILIFDCNYDIRFPPDNHKRPFPHDLTKKGAIHRPVILAPLPI